MPLTEILNFNLNNYSLALRIVGHLLSTYYMLAMKARVFCELLTSLQPQKQRLYYPYFRWGDRLGNYPRQSADHYRSPDSRSGLSAMPRLRNPIICLPLASENTQKVFSLFYLRKLSQPLSDLHTIDMLIILKHHLNHVNVQYQRLLTSLLDLEN